MMELPFHLIRRDERTVELRFDDLPDIYESAAIAEAVTAIADAVTDDYNTGLRERSFLRDADDRGVTVRLVFDGGV